MTPEEEQELLAPSDAFAEQQALEALQRRHQELLPQIVDKKRGDFARQPYNPATAQDTAPQAMQAQQPQERGFDLGRALTALGGGDVGAYDARNRYQAEGPMRDLAYRRAQGAAQDEEKQRLLSRALLDANSQESKQEQAAFSDYLQGLANAPGIPSSLSEQLKQTASNSWNMSASQIGRLKSYYDQLFGGTMKAITEGNRAALADENMDLRRMQVGLGAQHSQQSLGMQRESLNERRREFDIEQERKREADANKAFKVPPQTAIKTYNERSLALKEIARIEELLNSGKVRYTGWGANNVNSALSVLPGKMDVRNKEERELASLVKRLRAPERKNLFGAALSKFDIKDSSQFMADIEQNEETLRQNLGTLKSALMDSNALDRDQFPALMGDRRNLAASAGDPRAFGGAQGPGAAPALKAPPGATPGKRLRNPNDGKIYVVQPDGTMKPE